VICKKCKKRILDDDIEKEKAMCVDCEGICDCEGDEK
jgi:hypothetical protein